MNMFGLSFSFFPQCTSNCTSGASVRSLQVISILFLDILFGAHCFFFFFFFCFSFLCLIFFSADLLLLLHLCCLSICNVLFVCEYVSFCIKCSHSVHLSYTRQCGSHHPHKFIYLSLRVFGFHLDQ